MITSLFSPRIPCDCLTDPVMYNPKFQREGPFDMHYYTERKLLSPSRWGPQLPQSEDLTKEIFASPFYPLNYFLLLVNII